jgi:protein-disulfide isomerase
VATLIFINQPNEKESFLKANVYRNEMGDPNAPVTLIEYFDYQCGHCYSFYLYKEDLLLNQYVAEGKVYYIQRPFSSYPDSVNAAEAAYCAADQNKYWEMRNAIFDNYTMGYSTSSLITIAGMIDLDTALFEECLTNHKYTDQIAQDLAEGRAAGVTGTPSFVVNGQVVVVGDQEWSVFQQALDAAIAAAEAGAEANQ